MDVDNENTFLDNSSDETGDDAQAQESQKKQTKAQRSRRYEGQSNTIRIAPVPRNASESAIYEFIMSAVDDEPLSIALSKPKRRFANDKTHDLYDAQQAYVVLQTKEDAATAANNLNKTKFAGFECQVNVTAPSRNCSSTLKNKTKWITISNLSRNVTEQDILSHIQKNGKITNKPKSMYLFHHVNKENFSGFAFVECGNTNDASTCVDNLKNTTLKGEKMWCKFRPNRRDLDRKQAEFEGKTRQVLLGNLHYSMQQNDVMTLCAEYGQVEHVSIWYDNQGYPMGSASVTMANVEDAQSVFEGLQGEKVKNLKLITAYTKLTSPKKKVIDKLSGKNKSLTGKNKELRKDLKKEVIKNKQITKKLEKTEGKLRNNAPRARSGGRGRRDGVGSNRNTAFGKRSGGRGRGRGRGRGGRGGRRGPKFA